MKPGDLVVCLPEYTESETPVVGMILSANDLKWHARTIRYDVLFPEGVFPMYDYEIKLLDLEVAQIRPGYVRMLSIEPIDERR